MTGCTEMNIGAPVFAKVKGWMPYPARITGLKKKVQVLFYETEEINEVGYDCVWLVNPDTVKKLVTQKTLKRKYFRQAFEKMRLYHKISIGSEADLKDKTKLKEVEEEIIVEIEEQSEAEDNQNNPVEAEDSFDEDFNDIFIPCMKPLIMTAKVGQESDDSDHESLSDEINLTNVDESDVVKPVKDASGAY